MFTSLNLSCPSWQNVTLPPFFRYTSARRSAWRRAASGSSPPRSAWLLQKERRLRCKGTRRPWYRLPQLQRCKRKLYTKNTVREINIALLLCFLSEQNLAFHSSRVNPLQPKTFFSSVFEIKPKIGSYRLLTHRRDGHLNFFPWSLLFLNQNFNNGYIRSQMSTFEVNDKVWWRFLLAN